MERKPSGIGANEVLVEMISAATLAGKAALAFFKMGGNTTAKVTMKLGDSPVTEADLAANAVLVEQLRLRWPDYGWVSEEEVDSPERLTSKRLFIVDPIDGTRAFIAGKSEWCVSLALIEDQNPIAGVIHLPVLGLTYVAAKDSGAYLNGKQLSVSRKSTLTGSRFAGPKSIFDELQKKADASKADASKTSASMEFTPRVPSLAFRLVKVASGEIDLAAASTGAHDWDVAAADIVLREAGAVLTDESGRELIYNRASLRREILFAGHPTQVMLAR